MTLTEEIKKIKSIFIDTAPIIYYIEAHTEFGPLMKEIVNMFQQEKLNAFTSVLTLTEVLPKPIQLGKDHLAKEFTNFLKNGKNLNLIEINKIIAESAGWLRGKYQNLKTLDAIQLSAALSMNIDAFLTNDKSLKQIKEIKILLLKDYLVK